MQTERSIQKYENFYCFFFFKEWNERIKGRQHTASAAGHDAVDGWIPSLRRI